MKAIFFILLIFLISSLYAQTPPDTLWTKIFGGDESDLSYSIQQTSDGGYILGGKTSSYGAMSYAVIIIKTDENGIEQWSQIFDAGGYAECAKAVKQTSDGGYVIAGYKGVMGQPGTAIWLIKTDDNGVEEWNQVFGSDPLDDGANAILEIASGYVLGGYADSYGSPNNYDFCLIKTDEFGIEEWNQTFGGDDNDVCNSIQKTADEGYILAGYTESYGAGLSDIWLIKTDGNGIEQWNQTYGGTGNDVCNSIQQTVDSGYILAGYTESYGVGLRDGWLIKTDEYGNEQWSQTFGGTNDDVFNSVQQTADNGFIIGGHTGSFGGGDFDYWIVKTDENGIEQWSQSFSGNNNDICYSVQQTLDMGYITCGVTGLLGLEYEGDIWIIKLAPDNTEIDKNIMNFPLISSIQNYPNPFNPETTIKYSIPDDSEVELTIYNIKGQKVKTLLYEVLPAGEHSVIWNGRDSNDKRIGSGIYFYKLKTDKFKKTRKMILMK